MVYLRMRQTARVCPWLGACPSQGWLVRISKSHQGFLPRRDVRKADQTLLGAQYSDMESSGEWGWSHLVWAVPSVKQRRKGIEEAHTKLLSHS